jgi:hypothetical protein
MPPLLIKPWPLISHLRMQHEYTLKQYIMVYIDHKPQIFSTGDCKIKKFRKRQHFFFIKTQVSGVYSYQKWCMLQWTSRNLLTEKRKENNMRAGIQMS